MSGNDNEAVKPLLVAYRYLASEEHANAFTQGIARLSTFKWIRECDEARSDRDEGSLTYDVSRLGPETPPEEARLIRERLAGPFEFQDNGTAVVSNIRVRYQTPDALMLCLTEERSEQMQRTFGKYCVRIEHPEFVWQLIARFLKARMELTYSGFCPVQYRGRTFADADAEVGHQLVANVAGNAYEREARMIWTPKDIMGLSPMMIFVPDICRFCSVVDGSGT